MPDQQPKTTVIIPALNESKTICQVIEEIKQYCGAHIQEITVIHDGSLDNTSEAAEAVDCRVIRHARNRGYGAALKTGLRAATSEFVLVLDADGQHRGEHAAPNVANWRRHPLKERAKWLG